MDSTEFLASMKAIRNDLRQADEQRDAGALTTMYRHIRESMPADLPNFNSQAISSTAVTRLLRAGAWDEAAQWVPLLARGYGEHYDDVHLATAIIEWHTGDPKRGKQLLQQAWNDHGELPFRGREQYLAIARDGADTLPDTSDTLDVNDPRIQDLAERINDAMDTGDYSTAITLATQALAHLANPRLTDGPMWFLATIGDAHFLQGHTRLAHNAFTQAHQAQGGITNPFVLLRLGQTEHDLGDTDSVVEHLMAAHIADPTALETADPRYLQTLHDRGLL